MSAALHVLTRGSVVHSCGHHGEEDVWEEGAGVDRHLWERRSHDHLLLLVVESLHDLCRCLVRRNAERFLGVQHCKEQIYCVSFQDVTNKTVSLFVYSQDQTDLEESASVFSADEGLMKVWLMVLTEMPYSSTSALRQSKKAWTACLDAASGAKVKTQAQQTFILWGP